MNEAAAKAMADINERYKTTVITTADKLRGRCTRHSGSIAVDVAMHGGLPKGGMVEVYGDEGVGKTTFCYHAMAQAQREGFDCMLLDVENRADQQHSLRAACGVDDARLHIARFEYAQQFLDVARSITALQGCAIVALDSIGGTSPLAWQDKNQAEDAIMTERARCMNEFVRLATSALSHDVNLDDHATYNDTTLLLTNHTYVKIGGFTRPGLPPPMTTAGGRGKNFMCLFRISLKAKRPEYDKATSLTRREIGFKITKSSVGAENEGTYELVYTDDGGTVAVNNDQSLFAMLRTKHNMLRAGPKTWSFFPAATLIAGEGPSIDLGGKAPTAEQFVTDNFAYCFAEVVQVEQHIHKNYAGYTIPPTDTVVLKGKDVPLATALR
jgi:recombination protein RecA